jgi:hypothetical protein
MNGELYSALLKRKMLEGMSPEHFEWACDLNAVRHILDLADSYIFTEDPDTMDYTTILSIRGALYGYIVDVSDGFEEDDFGDMLRKCGGEDDK